MINQNTLEKSVANNQMIFQKINPQLVIEFVKANCWIERVVDMWTSLRTLLKKGNKQIFRFI